MNKKAVAAYSDEIDQGIRPMPSSTERSDAS